jgi:hypothetical protein
MSFTQKLTMRNLNFNILKRNFTRWNVPLSRPMAAATLPLFSAKQTMRIHTSNPLRDVIDVESRGRKVKGVRSVGLADVDGIPAAARKTWAYCTAEEYDFSRLKPALEQKYAIAGYLVDDVFHIRLATPSQELPDSLEQLEKDDAGATPAAEQESFSGEPEAFIFENGTFVVWGATQQDIEHLRQLLSSYEVNSVRPVETEWFDFVVDAEAYV